MNPTNVTRKALESAPERASWKEATTYSSIYLLNTRKMHDSGFGLICIVGMKSDGTLEKAATCDDICWHHDPSRNYTMRTDMTHPAGVVHCWGWSESFTVGVSLSSTDVYVHKKAAA